MVQKALEGTHHIFVVDDEPANTLIIRKSLQMKGYKDIVEIHDPTEVFPLYEEQRPDIILLDINMPKLDGFQVLEKLEQMNDPLLPPVLVLTAQNQEETIVRALNAGAKDFVAKPFNIQEMLSRVRNLLDGYLAKKLMYEQKSTLEMLVDKRTKELTDSQMEMVRRLGKAAEYKDEETGNHIIRMSYTCKFIAEELGWEDQQVDLILRASPMHDLGKIGIPDKILLKPGKFEPEEWEIMKTHAEIGADLLDGNTSDLVIMAREIAISHHEKWDGSGYPKGLSKTDIPISGRIAAVADVFDALTSKRPYKEKWPIEKALDLIQSESGKHFDPEVVQAFFKVLDKVKVLIEQYSD